jgi:23S rRNA pseudouridine1911/1915/1917 synthase
MRLDLYLVDQHPDKTRAYWQRMIKKGLIKLNGVTIHSPKYAVSEPADVDIDQECLEESELLAEDIPLDIIYEDPDLLVINKQAGMVVHPAYGHNTGTLVNALLFHCKDLSGIGGVKRPGIVHRLDKDTSGLIVVAKNDTAHVFLSQQFHPDTKQASRLYKAVIHGVPQKMEDTLNFSISKDSRHFDRMRVSTRDDAKTAITHYKVLSVFGTANEALHKRYSLVECELFTGRTHQIRVHFSHIRHPIVGDTLYGSPRSDVRLMLHACALSFIHPKTNERMYFEAELPKEMFAAALQTLTA